MHKTKTNNKTTQDRERNVQEMEGWKAFCICEKGHANKSGIDGSKRKVCVTNKSDTRRKGPDYITKTTKETLIR